MVKYWPFYMIHPVVFSSSKNFNQALRVHFELNWTLKLVWKNVAVMDHWSWVPWSRWLNPGIIHSVWLWEDISWPEFLLALLKRTCYILFWLFFKTWSEKWYSWPLTNMQVRGDDPHTHTFENPHITFESLRTLLLIAYCWLEVLWVT